MERRDPHELYERLGEVIRAVRAVTGEAYAAIGVGSAQAKLLRHIGRRGPMSQADLARATDTAPTLTGRALEPLVRKALVRRRRSEEDRREYELELTARGQRLRARVEAAREGVIARLAAVLDDRDVGDFDRIARRILQALESGERAGERRERA